MNKDKSELDPKQVFNLVGHQFDLMEGRVRPTQDRWQTLQIRDLMTGPVCPFWKIMSHMALLTAIEKQVHLGRLHMRPIQWHLKNNWRVPETLEKVIPISKALHPHMKCWLEESYVLTGQPLHPLKHALQILTDAFKRRVGCSLKRAHYKGKLVPSRKQTTHKLSGTKNDLLSTKRVPGPLYKQHSPHSHRQHNSGCIHQQGGRDEDEPTVCPRVENTDLVCQKASYSQRSIPGRLNVIADKISRLGQTIQTEWYPSRGPQSYMLPVAPAQNGPVCHQVPEKLP